MGGELKGRALGGARVVLVSLAVVLAAGGVARAQQQNVRGSAELKQVNGRVEVLRSGQTQWVPAVVGARLVEGDDVRAPGGASAELVLTDGSTLFLAENSRLHITKLEHDPQTQTRVGIFHLAVGKVKAVVSQAAITLVRARQSNFAITTPTAVAAARGTTYVTVFDEIKQQMDLAVLPEKSAQPSRVGCFGLGDRFRVTTVDEGLYTQATNRGCAPPVPIPDLGIDSVSNRMPLGPGYYGPVNPVPPGVVLGAGQPAPVTGLSSDSAAAPTSFGRDLQINQSFQVPSTNPTNP